MTRNDKEMNALMGFSEIMNLFSKYEKLDVLAAALDKVYGIHDGFTEWVNNHTEQTIDAIDTAISERKQRTNKQNDECFLIYDSF